MATPIVQTATYTFQNTDELIAYQEGTFGSYEYGRYGNPTSRACELKVRSRRATRASPRSAPSPPPPSLSLPACASGLAIARASAVCARS